MSDLPRAITIREVGPREGFQFEKGPIPTARKIELVDALSGTGLKHIQVTSFVSPKWVPQMADADEITEKFWKAPGVEYDALYLNDRGLERALAHGVYHFRGHLTMVASNVFAKTNTNKTIDELIAAIPSRIALYKQHGIKTRAVGVQAAFGCNYQGDVPLEDVLKVVGAAIDVAAEHDETIEEIRLSDTMGWGNPIQTKRMIGAVQDRWPDASISLHLHDTRATAMANAMAALEMGVSDFDSSVGGLGGCPFASHKGSAGNIVTEDLAFMCEEMGIATGVDLDKLIECAALAEDVVGHPLPSKLLRGGTPEPDPRGGEAGRAGLKGGRRRWRLTPPSKLLTGVDLMAHLYRRAGFGATRDEIEAALAKGYEATVEELLHPESQPDIDFDVLHRFYPDIERGARDRRQPGQLAVPDDQHRPAAPGEDGAVLALPLRHGLQQVEPRAAGPDPDRHAPRALPRQLPRRSWWSCPEIRR